jgi:hypothetical protein
MQLTTCFPRNYASARAVCFRWPGPTPGRPPFCVVRGRHVYVASLGGRRAIAGHGCFVSCICLAAIASLFLCVSPSPFCLPPICLDAHLDNVVHGLTPTLQLRLVASRSAGFFFFRPAARDGLPSLRCSSVAVLVTGQSLPATDLWSNLGDYGDL